MNLDLEGKVAVVTGSSKGIGFATAKLLVEEGAKVAICSRNAEEIKAASEQLEKMGGNVYYQVVDMTNESEVYEFGANVVKHFGKIDCWVNNVGAQLTHEKHEYSDAFLEKMFGICFKSTVFGCQAAFRAMKKTGGSIVNISSLAARCPSIGKSTIYGPLKSGVNMLTTTMAGEYAAYNVRVNCVMPGYTMTEHNVVHTPESEMKHICAGAMMQRAGDVEEVARPIVFLCGSGSTFMTGESIEVSGGRGLTLNSDFSYSKRIELGD